MPRQTPPDLGLTDALVQLSFAIEAALSAAAATHDLSLTQLRLLGILRDREPLMLDLARMLDLEKSSVTGLIDRAARRDLVERTTASHDGRAVRVRLTATGRRIATELTAAVSERVASLAAPLPARDRTTLSRLATHLVLDDATRRGIDLTPG